MTYDTDQGNDPSGHPCRLSADATRRVCAAVPPCDYTGWPLTRPYDFVDPQADRRTGGSPTMPDTLRREEIVLAECPYAGCLGPADGSECRHPDPDPDQPHTFEPRADEPEWCRHCDHYPTNEHAHPKPERRCYLCRAVLLDPHAAAVHSRVHPTRTH
jgi:hypothetical protein